MVDIPGNKTTTATFLGDPLTLAMASGEFETFGDQDWIAVTLLAGTRYSFVGSAQGPGPNGGDSVLTLYSSDGATVVATDDDNGAGNNSVIRYTAATTGTYYISIRDYSGSPGQWSLGVSSAYVFDNSNDDGDNTSTLIAGGFGILEAFGRGRDRANNYVAAMGEQGDDTMDGGDNGSYLSGGIGNDSVTGGTGNDLLFGDLGYDYIYAYAGNDTLYGGDQADVLYGAEGNDVTYGGDGADYISDYTGQNTIFGEGGDDKVYAGNGRDFVRGGSGRDTMDGGSGALDLADYADKTSSVRVTLSGATAATVFVNGVAEDSISNFEFVVGGSAGDKLKGDAFANQLYGNAGKDTLLGGDGNDSLHGGLKNDTLKGGGGADYFFFDTKIGSRNVDTILRFKSGEDKIVLDDAVMSALGSAMTANQFYKAAGATQGHDKSDRVIYNTSTGALYYDKDGSGSQNAVKIAILANDPALSFTDFIIV
jgi:Ca2+-binding RTX toxin-like protein